MKTSRLYRNIFLVNLFYSNGKYCNLIENKVAKQAILQVCARYFGL